MKAYTFTDISAHPFGIFLMLLKWLGKIQVLSPNFEDGMKGKPHAEQAR